MHQHDVREVAIAISRMRGRAPIPQPLVEQLTPTVEPAPTPPAPTPKAKPRQTVRTKAVPRRLGVNKASREDRAREVARLTAMLPALTDGLWHPLSWWCEQAGVEYNKRRANRTPITAALKQAGAVKHAFGWRADGRQRTENRYQLLRVGQPADEPKVKSMTRGAIAQRRHRARMRLRAP